MATRSFRMIIFLTVLIATTCVQPTVAVGLETIGCTTAGIAKGSFVATLQSAGATGAGIAGVIGLTGIGGVAVGVSAVGAGVYYLFS
ncbi:hypothetical protein Ocin01_10865 [Orchesella cincta]|uniref:Interferon alpha-inducible protein 27, mitochondrial n=1 Tax=Orchesella cincta TaxID=48709 RepID=A0A1D2MSQ0_ORCCI|nr:hypothetical protein Ocin01_10865 [Orchesella cincta]